MLEHEIYMRRCLQLAEKGLGSVSTNPLVGAVLVYDGKIIGEGYHKKFGEAHAEVNAIASVEDKELLKLATLYINIEPCSHFGKTPPCANLIIESGIKKVVVGIEDPFIAVQGRGVKMLKDAGIEVILGVLESECKEINRRFLTFYMKRRPYIILKWAQTANGKIGSGTDETWQISGDDSFRLSHKWRTEEDAILVGFNTALHDNPRLTSRLWPGRNPQRLLLDPEARIGKGFQIMDDQADTIVFSSVKQGQEGRTKWVSLNEVNYLPSIIISLFDSNIQSLIVEGGATVHKFFLNSGIWDETRVVISDQWKQGGVDAAPVPSGRTKEYKINDDRLLVIRNTFN
jgi:diaminohydroxyphosphoribosylaminopyrimidine deaminase/5-amino-6-(5-phosphoribosylamino)uracil reductase